MFIQFSESPPTSYKVLWNYSAGTLLPMQLTTFSETYRTKRCRTWRNRSQHTLTRWNKPYVSLTGVCLGRKLHNLLKNFHNSYRCNLRYITLEDSYFFLFYQEKRYINSPNHYNFPHSIKLLHLPLFIQSPIS